MELEEKLRTIEKNVPKVYAAGVAAGGGFAEEIDPTVPAWAKQPEKPTYTAEEVGALPADATVQEITEDADHDHYPTVQAVKAYVDAALGEVATALDGILAEQQAILDVQAELLGGGDE